MFRGALQAQAGLLEGRASNGRAVAGRLFSYFTPYWRRLIAILALAVLTAIVGAAGPYLIGRAIDQYITHGDPVGLAQTMLLLIGCYVVGLLARFVQTYFMGWLSQQVLSKLRENLFTTIQAQSLQFFDRHESGDLMARLVSDVDVISNLLGQGLIQAVSGVLGIVGIVVAMFLLNWPLAIASFLVIPAMFITANIFAGLARRAFRETRQTIGDVSANLQEDIAGVKVAQAFNRTGLNQARFAKRNAANRDANVGATAVTSAFYPAMDLLSTIAIAIVACLGGYEAIQGTITVGVVIAFLSYVQQFFWPVQQLGQLYTQSQSALAAAERIFELIDLPVGEETRLTLNPSPAKLTVGPGEASSVVFDHVSFAYEPGHDVLRGVSLAAAPGQTVALVGPTGAGKTTIVNLIARFYEVTAGQILIDDVDTRDMPVTSLRQMMGIVPQNSFLFAGTILDNIRYGRLDATDAEVEEAARLVNAHPFISALPQGYQTHLGERGGSISQGQRQLIAFARALLANPRILILDEATSSVDTRTEQLIQQALGNLLQNRTSFVIAHRLSTIRNADQVLVIDDGQIVERGTHQSLLALGGLYAELYNRQFRERVGGEARMV